MKVNKKLTLKEKLQIFVKRTKAGNFKTGLIVFIITLSLLIELSYRNAAFGSLEASSVQLKPVDKAVRISCVFAGDIMMGRSIRDVTDRYGYEYLFRNVEEILKSADYASGNFESAVLNREEEEYSKAEKNIHLYTEMDAVKTLKNMHFTVLNLANNHTLDYGEKGLTDTLEAFKNNGLSYVGAGENIKDAGKINIKKVKGLKIATLGFSDVTLKGFDAGKNQGGIMPADPEEFLRLIQKADKEADLVIVNCHWGEEYEHIENPKQETFARAMVDAGADIVIGHHPHVLQPVEVYKDSIIFYSLGNFVFDQGWNRTKDSVLANYELGEDGKGTFNIIPLRINEGTPGANVSSYHSRRIFNTLTKNLSSDRYYIEHGRLIIKVDNSRIIKNAEVLHDSKDAKQ